MYISDPKLRKVVNPSLKFLKVIAEPVHIEHHANHLLRLIPAIPVFVSFFQGGGTGFCGMFQNRH